MDKRFSDSISRRAFLGFGAAAGIAAGVVGLSGCSPTASNSGNSKGTNTQEPTASNVHIHGVTDTSWMNPPTEITQFVKELDCDAVVCGYGFAGTTATREIAEQGKKVIVVEMQPEDTYAATGWDIAALNPSILQERGVPYIEPTEFFQNFMKMSANIPNPSLVMKFAQKSGETIDWYFDRMTEADFDQLEADFFPPTEHQISELDGIKFWPSVCQFHGTFEPTDINLYNKAISEEHGAEFLFATKAEYIIMENGAVAGVVASDSEGYIKINCRAVVCSCGGMGGNPDMMAYFMPDVAQALTDGESFSCMVTNEGTGVQMAYWAGAHLETTPIPGMNMKGMAASTMSSMPQAVWVDETGKRFCNEFYPGAEQRGYQITFMNRRNKFVICDDNFTEYRQYTIPQHGAFEATEYNLKSLRNDLDKAYAVFKGTYKEGDYIMEPDPTQPEDAPVSSTDFIADDTLEGLAGQLGLTGEAVSAFVDQIGRYNSFCDNGVDEEFGRAKDVLFPVKKSPFYAVVCEPQLGSTMTTLGGILTDENQNAVDDNYEPIPGLYVSGNDCGRRFGIEYITPIPGLSLGFAITLGRECGKSVAEFLG